MQEKKPCKNLKIRKVTIVGVIPSFAFQRAKYCALELHRKLPQKFPLPEIVGMLELDWSEKLMEWRQTQGREYWCLRRPVAVFFDGTFIGSDIELLKLTSIGNVLFDSIPRKDMSCLKNNFRKDYIAFLKKSKRVYCYLDICVDDVYIGTLTFQLYSDLLPRTCENFKTLCLGNKGSFLTYKGSRIHRIVKKGWLQGGDIQYKTGGGGFSIFCDSLEDECFGIKHDRKGVLSMANGGRHKNNSQFFITLNSTEWMNGNFVAFGQLIEGSKVLKKLEDLETFYECPKNKIEIKSCGKLDLEDVEDIDAAYREESLPKKKPMKFETITEQIIRLIMEALTDALARKEYTPDVLDDRDIASKMNIQLYFQGLYSIPEEIVEESARYFRKFRRELLRIVKPSATEIVEVIMYDLLMAVLARMTNLDDIRETIGHELYQKMVGGINMTLEMCKKSYVKRLVDQIVSTAESMVTLITKKLKLMKRKSGNLRAFQDKMQNWVQSFVRQETFLGDSYNIAEKRDMEPPKPEKKTYPFREGFPVPCCEKPKEGDSVDQLDTEDKAKFERLKTMIPPEDICCLGTKLLSSEAKLTFSKLFSTCNYDLKKKYNDNKVRMPLLQLIEVSRFRLRRMRKQESRVKSPERLCLEKKIRKWMDGVYYTPESCWIRDTIFEPDEIAIDHIEDIMYGAMTVGLIEMYYFYEQYLKLCGAVNKKRINLNVGEENFEDYSEQSVPSEKDFEDGENADKAQIVEEPTTSKEDEEEDKDENEEKDEDEIEGEGIQVKEEIGEGEGSITELNIVDEEEEEKEKEAEKEVVEEKLPSCKCGHPCCVCAFDPNFNAGPPPPTSDVEGDRTSFRKRILKDGSISNDYRGPDDELDEDEETEGEGKEEIKSTISKEIERDKKVKPCPSGTELIDLNEVMAETVSLRPAEIDIKSFKWLRSYVLEHGCDLKTEFATQTHKWLEGDRFGYKGFFSKHSLVTRASLLSLSLSLAEIIKEENKFKVEIRNFIYDLWELYFNEMFKEAFLEFPQLELEEEEKKDAEEEERERKKEKDLKSELDNELDADGKLSEKQMRERILKGKELLEKGGKNLKDADIEQICEEYFGKDNDGFDLKAFCAKFAREKDFKDSNVKILEPKSFSNVDFMGSKATITFEGRRESIRYDKSVTSKYNEEFDKKGAISRRESIRYDKSVTSRQNEEIEKKPEGVGRRESVRYDKSVTSKYNEDIDKKPEGVGRRESVKYDKSVTKQNEEGEKKPEGVGRRESVRYDKSVTKQNEEGEKKPEGAGRRESVRYDKSVTSKYNEEIEKKPGGVGRRESVKYDKSVTKHDEDFEKEDGHEEKKDLPKQDRSVISRHNEDFEKKHGGVSRRESVRYDKSVTSKHNEEIEKKPGGVGRRESVKYDKSVTKHDEEFEKEDGHEEKKDLPKQDRSVISRHNEDFEKKHGGVSRRESVKYDKSVTSKHNEEIENKTPGEERRLLPRRDKHASKRHEETDKKTPGEEKKDLHKHDKSSKTKSDEMEKKPTSEGKKDLSKHEKSSKFEIDETEKKGVTRRDSVKYDKSVTSRGKTDETEKQGDGRRDSVKYDKSVTSRGKPDDFEKGNKEEEGEAEEETKLPKKTGSNETDDSSSEETRSITTYANPFWVTFLTELTKQALAALSKASVLPKRLYFKSDTETDFNEKMKEWFEFNAFNPKPTKGRELIDYIALHHQSLADLDESARSYLKKKKYSGLINRCTRFSSADDLAKEILTDVVETAVVKQMEADTFELFLSSMITTALATAPEAKEEEEEEEEIELLTDKRNEYLGEIDD